MEWSWVMASMLMTKKKRNKMSKVRFESQSVFVGWAGLIQLKGENVSQALDAQSVSQPASAHLHAMLLRK